MGVWFHPQCQVFVVSKMGPTLQVSEAEACRIADSICEELTAAGEIEIESSPLLGSMQRLHSTGHTPRLFGDFEAAGLTAKIEIDHVWIGWNHPILPFKNVVRCLSEERQLGLILGADPTLGRYKTFWERYQKIAPEHEVYKQHSDRLSSVVPLLIHADEGTSQKKRPLMVIQVQPLMGAGTSRGPNDLNYIGNSLTTRFLFSVLQGKLYADKLIFRLRRVVDALIKELTSLFHDGVEVCWNGQRQRIYFACLGMKGDWPALAKLGMLTRHHLRDGQKQIGICHLCKAGMPDCPWHEASYEALERMHQHVPSPWNQPSSLLSVPQDWSKPETFYHIDVFHTFHKGIAGDLCANAIVPR